MKSLEKISGLLGVEEAGKPKRIGGKVNFETYVKLKVLSATTGKTFTELISELADAEVKRLGLEEAVKQILSRARA